MRASITVKQLRPVRLGARFRRRQGIMLSRLDVCLASPEDNAVHELRTAIRRWEMCYRCLPPANRSVAMENYYGLIRQLFSAKGKVRDCDVMLTRLAGMGFAKRAKSVALLGRRRQRALQAACPLARKMAQLTPPSPGRISSRENQYFLDTLQNQYRKFMNCRTQILRRDNSVSTLHELRKAAKKLFYLLELTPPLALTAEAGILRAVQKLTGEIHDCDVLIGVLESRTGTEAGISVALKSLRQERRRGQLALRRMLVNPVLSRHWLPDTGSSSR